MKNKMAIEKGRTRRLLVRSGWSVFVLLVVFVACFTFYRLRGLTTKERAAFVLMHQDYRPKHGINAFPLLFYIGYDVPDDRFDEQMATDIKKLRQSLAADSLSSIQFINIDVPPLSTLSQEEITVLCSANGKGCLTQVSAHPDEVRTALTAHSTIIQRSQAFEHTDYYWDLFPADNRIHSSIKEYNNIARAQRLLLNGYALAYVDGNRISALTATCRNIAAWRRMRHGSNSMLNILNTSIFIDGAIRLYADMLKSLPSNEAVPVDCALALQPIITADVDRCAALARLSEISEVTSLHDRALDSKKSFAIHLLGNILINHHLNLVWTTQILAASCDANAVKHLLTDEYPHREPVRYFLGIPFTKGVACIANIAGCVLLSEETPLLVNFDEDTLDQAAHLRLAATLLWLREHPGGSIEERFEQRPAQLRSPNHHSWYDAKNNMLYVENFNQTHRRDKQFGLPIALPD
jgi:hypothetical protein